MLTGQITCAKKVSIYGKNKQTNKQTNKETKTKQNHIITDQLPASLQF